MIAVAVGMFLAGLAVGIVVGAHLVDPWNGGEAAWRKR